MNEIKKSEIKTYKIFLSLIIYVLFAMYIFNMTIAKYNFFLSDILTVVAIGVYVYFLYRYNIISYRYIIDENNLTINKIAGKNNEQGQAIIEICNIINFDKKENVNIKKIKKLNFCATLNKSQTYVIITEIESEKVAVFFQPSIDMVDEINKRRGNKNEEN